jgi:hypothetical protein
MLDHLQCVDLAAMRIDFSYKFNVGTHIGDLSDVHHNEIIDLWELLLVHSTVKFIGSHNELAAIDVKSKAFFPLSHWLFCTSRSLWSLACRKLNSLRLARKKKKKSSVKRAR